MRNIFTILLTCIFLINCSDPITELKENIFPAQDNAQAENEYSSTIEAMTDWIANTKFYKKSERIVPANAIVSLNDSSFSDFDGVDGYIDFGMKGSAKPFGLLCSDGKYRAGKIHFYLNKPFELPGSIFEIKIEKKDSFYSGSGDKMNLLSGTFSVENSDGISLNIKADKLIMVYTDGNTIQWNCNRIIRLIKDAGKGVWGDIYSIEGTAHGTCRNGEVFNATIEQPLIKKMEPGCSKTFIKGILSIKNTSTDKSIRVNYDPKNDEACDNIIEADINGKKSVFKID